ncbi:MAG TPA: fatty acid desaturase [Azospirillaceae bacterium]|nr:fatty acid desaturase [Azospirillaceae bacterium]
MTTPPPQPAGHPPSGHDDILYPSTIPFILVHLACLGAIWTGVHWQDVAICVGLYGLRIFAIGAAYHRYFSHRSYKTSRWFQFVLAFLAMTTTQKGVLWWAAKHRVHHRYSDTEHDVHSPRQKGFWYSHMGWIFDRKYEGTDYALVQDFAKYPELMWLDRHQNVPPVIMAVTVFLFAGWSGLVVGFFWSTVLLYHATFCINSLAHVHGSQRYVTGDDSRNNWWFALLTMGEGWHNNHHAYQASTRQGFRWWEVDMTYYILKAFSWVGLVWDLHEPPKAVVRGEHKVGRPVIEKAARQLAASFHADQIAAQVAEMLTRTPTLAELRSELEDKLANARKQAEALLASVQLPAIPSTQEVKERASRMFARSPSMDDIVERARQLVIEGVCARLAAA